jgi:hypothetical protein
MIPFSNTAANKLAAVDPAVSTSPLPVLVNGHEPDISLVA